MIEIGENRSRCPPLYTGPKWRDKSMDAAVLEAVMETATLANGSAEELSGQLKQILARACDASMPRRSNCKRGTPCYWWSEEISAIRINCLRHRRKVQRSRHRNNFEEYLAAFKTARQNLKRAIKENKRRCFQSLCDEAEVNPWGTAFKVVMTRLKGDRSPPLMCPVMLKNIVDTLFPARTNSLLHITREINVRDIPKVTNEEILEACQKFKDRKTPGPDGIPNKAFKLAVELRPDLLVKTVEKCLHEGVFPKRWKLQHLVLLPKGKGKLGEPSSYRPICLLDTLGKALERVIYNRLLSHAEASGALSDMQFGFRKNRSTVDAIKTVVDIATAAIDGDRWLHGTKEYCAVTTLDVKNAFNSADWSNIRRSLARINTPPYLRNIVESYFTGRKLRYSTSEGTKVYSVSAGVPQGSVLGPLLWNIMYDGVLRLAAPAKTKIIGFADDVAVVTVAKTISEIEAATNETVRLIRHWLQCAGLELADHKTEAVLISSRKKVEFISVTVGSEVIRSKESIKYLGAMIDNKLNFKRHVQYATEKASRLQSALARMLPNVGGPKHQKRILLSQVVSSALLYAAPVWSKALAVQETRRTISSVHRLSALRAISGFRTISQEAAYVIAGMVPIDILADEMARVYKRKSELRAAMQGQTGNSINKEERIISLERWQNRWDSTTKGRWTYRLIPDVNAWVSRKHGECKYQLTQFLSGHGGYRKYLHRFGHDNSPFCPECPIYEEDSEHAVFHCPRFARYRREGLNAESIVNFMMQSETNWLEIEELITTIQVDLRRYEEMRQRDEVA